jgi:lipid-binding SYLF domain-containing protein
MSKLSCVVLAAVCATACASAPKSAQDRQTLQQQASVAVGQMINRDPTLQPTLQHAYAYAIFPEVGKAGALFAGGAYGRGVLYVQGQPAGFVTLTQGSVGFELGGQTFSELLVLNTPAQVQALQAGQFNVGAQASAVIVKSGAAAQTQFANNVGVFVMPRGGLMAGISLTGQQINFQPLSG